MAERLEYGLAIEEWVRTLALFGPSRRLGARRQDYEAVSDGSEALERFRTVAKDDELEYRAHAAAGPFFDDLDERLSSDVAVGGPTDLVRPHAGDDFPLPGSPVTMTSQGRA